MRRSCKQELNEEFRKIFVRRTKINHPGVPRKTAGFVGWVIHHSSFIIPRSSFLIPRSSFLISNIL